MIAISMISISMGHHYYYRIHNGGDTIADIQVEQITESGSPIQLVEQSSIDYEDTFTMIHFDAVNTGSGFLKLSFMQQTVCFMIKSKKEKDM